MLGRETNQPADLMFGEGQEKIYSGNDEYVMGLENAIKNAHEVARKTLKTYTRSPFLYCFSSIFTS
jgi:hypothetical protein